MLSRFGLKRVLCGLFVLFTVGGTAGAQDAGIASQSATTAAGSFVRPSTGLFNIVALRVEFQPDTTRFTTGDGTFATDPYEGLVPAVDPLPHDVDFFNAHLDGLADYLDAVSDGQVEVRHFLLPEVVRVQGRMQEYTPTGLDTSIDEELSKLAALIREAWTTAAEQIDVSLPSDVEPDRTFFLLLHAGVGRDIELVGTTLDKTPLDIPSIFFDREALERLGASGLALAGLPVTNTAIIPRTETRRGFDFISDEPFLVELTTNGLLAASFLNFLGAPDLFNTETGESAIGPYGLMDPLGIFAYGGLIPPEPSAWTKVFLDWVQPLEIRSDLPVDLVMGAASTDSSDIVRVWISDSEYFLVENRHRDTRADGLVIRVWNGGTVTEQRVVNGDPDFNSVNVQGFAGGVVVGVDEYDWALPGGLDENDNPLVGGALVWHVDERRIRETIENNRVNSDPSWRGVDLEEADSGQDLGFPSQGVFGPALDQGSPFDFYYEGNPATVITASGSEVRLYENRFGNDTYPNSKSNGGGPSFIEIADFSPPGPQMTFTVRRQEGGVAVPVEDASFLLRDFGYSEVTITADTGIKWCDEADEPFYAVTAAHEDGRRAIVIADDAGLVTVIDSREIADAQPACAGNRLYSLTSDGVSYALVWNEPRTGSTRSVPVGVPSSTLSPATPILIDGDHVYVGFASETDGLLAIIGLSDESVRTVELPSVVRSLAAADAGDIAVGTDGRVLRVDRDGSTLTEWDLTGTGISGAYRMAFGSDADGLLGVVATATHVGFLFADGSHQIVGVSGSLGGGSPPAPVLDDVDGDGRLDALLPDGDRFVAITRGGAVASRFPIGVGAPVRGQILTGVVASGRSLPWLVVTSELGYIYAVDLERGGRVVDGFPLAASAIGTPAWRDDRLYTVSASGDFRVWKVTGLGAPRWSEFLGDARNRSFAELDTGGPAPSGSSVLVASETYNWPNPVSEGRTNFRFATTEDASLIITIVDMAGGRVDELRAPQVRAGAPAEVAWETVAQSGVYFARVAATTVSGRTESRLIRFAILR